MTPAASSGLVHALLVNAAVSLIIGTALLLVWRHHRGQAFTRDLGLAHLVQVLIPLGYVFTQLGDDTHRFAGMVVIIVSQTVSVALMVLGINRLSRWTVSRAEWAVFILLMSSAGAWVLASGDRSVAAWLSPSFNTLLGLSATRWLWRSRTAEKVVGPLLLFLGLSQFAFALQGEAALTWQASAGTVLRAALGLTLVYAALERSSDEMRRLRDRFRHLIERSHQGVIVRDGGQLLYANEASLGIYGYQSSDGVTLDQLERALPSGELAQVTSYFQRLESGATPEQHWEGLRHRRDGTPMWLRFSAWRTLWDDQPATQILVTDLTAQHDTTQALLHQAMHDELTGLPNRSALLQRLRERCATAGAHAPFGLVLLGIDRFKLFNEAHGHSLGDEVLKAMGQALLQELGDDAQPMRLGADEFAWLAPSGVGGLDAATLAERVQRMLRQPLVLPLHRFFLDVSIGIAHCPSHASDAESLLRAANAAMHVAKKTPGTSLALAEARFERGSSDLLAQEQALRGGIERREFSLHYQPKVDAWSGRLIGFEALARWHRAEIGWVGPGDFIAAAERTGLIAELGALLLRQACEQVAVWRDAFEEVVPVAVNVSPLQMLDGGFPALVLRLLQECRLPPQAITLELTESAAVANLAQARDQIGQLRALGVEVALDDFGTGFSSLNMLRSLPVHTIKIDRGLIDPLPAPDAVAVIAAICQLATALRLRVVAEGVENQAQAESARLAGCHVLQGELFAQPLTLSEAGDWLSESVSEFIRLT